MRYILFLLPLLTACDKRIIVNYGEPRLEEQSVSCDYVGLCYACGVNSRGNYKCGVGFHTTCSGHQQATVQRTPYTWYWESKPDQKQMSYEERVVNRHGECK